MPEKKRPMPVDRKRVTISRAQARAVQTLVARQEAVDDLEKMRKRAEAARDKAIRRAAEAGVNHAEIGRVIGLSKGRVWQLLRAMGAIPAKGEPAAEREEEATPKDEAASE